MGFKIQTEKDLQDLIIPPAITSIIGKAKIGKSTWASLFPKPVFVWTERGAAGLKVPKLPPDRPVKDWTELLSCILQLQTDEHDRCTLVLDTIDVAQRLCMAHVITEKYGGDAAKFEAYKQGYVPMRQEFRRLLKGLGQARDKRNMNIVIISHEGILRGPNTLGEDYKMLGGNLEPECWKMLRDFSDQIGYAAVKTKAVKNKIRDIGGSERFLFFGDHPGREAGCRAGYEMPSEIKLSFDEYAKHMKGILNNG